MAENLSINSTISLLNLGVSTGLTTLSGDLNVDYDKSTVTGSLSVDLGGVLGLQNYSNFTLTQGSDGTYTIAATQGALGLTNATISYTGEAPTTANSSVNLLSTGLSVAGGTASVTSTVVCFAEGTLIRTPNGDIAIEDLAVGDLVLTSSGASRQIRWIGHRTIDCRNHPNPRAALPVRIAAHAFGPDLPEAELIVSPGHAICLPFIEEVLVPASALINGSTVVQIDVEKVSYWHIELESHEIIMANGMPAESYIDMSNRAFFEGAEGNIDPERSQQTINNYCRPFIDETLQRQALSARVKSRAISLGWTEERTPFADLHLEVDGQIIHPDTEGMTARFLVPADAQQIALISKASRPVHLGLNTDTRKLGVSIGKITAFDGLSFKREMSADDTRLTEGFHPAEQTARGARRWTNGRAELPAALWKGANGHFFLRVELTALALPIWQPPKSQELALTQSEYAPHLKLVSVAA